MRAACSQIIDSIGELSIHDTQPRGLTPEEIKLRHIGNCMKADPAYGDGRGRYAFRWACGEKRHSATTEVTGFRCPPHDAAGPWR